jgi:hypothetical protein
MDDKVNTVTQAYSESADRFSQIRLIGRPKRKYPHRGTVCRRKLAEH